MKRSNRVLLVAVLLEALVIAIGAWLLRGISIGTLSLAVSRQEAVSTITSVLGGAIGIIAGLCGAIWLVLRNRERNGQ